MAGKGSGFVFNTGRAVSLPCDVNIEFADGWHMIPAWMVPHLGGTDKVLSEESMAAARSVTFEEFNRRFHNAASRETLGGIQKQIISSHLRRLY